MFLKISGAFGLALLAIGGTSARALAAAKYEPPGDTVYHGASLPDTWSETGLDTQMRQYQAVAGKRLSVITWFASTYENGRMTSWKQNYASTLARVKRVGAISLIKFSTQDYAYDQTKRKAALPDIARGVYDAYFVDAAQAVKQFGGPVFISIDHEMNGTWYPYSQAYPGSKNTAADYVAAWRRIVAIFRSQGATNAAFVWSPNVPDVGPIPYTQYYPGDDVVDWVGVSFYSGNRMEALDAIYRTYADRKPIFITEWATAPEKSQYYPGYPGDSTWVRDFFQALASRYPRVKAISWFNWNKSDGNYLLQRVPGQAQTYAADIASPRFLDNPNLGHAPATPQLPRIARPDNEIILREIPAVAKDPVVVPKRARIHLSIVPDERVAVER